MLNIYMPPEIINKILSYRIPHPINNLICCKFCYEFYDLQIFHNDISGSNYVYINTNEKTSLQKRQRVKPAGFHIICSDCIRDESKG